MAKATQLLSRDAILRATDLVTEEVEVPEWGGVVRVKALTGAERDQFEAGVVERRGRKTEINMKNLRARLVALSVIDEDGRPLFRPTDAEALGQKSAAALGRVFDVAMRLSGMTEQDLDELTENFTNGQSGDSISA